MHNKCKSYGYRPLKDKVSSHTNTLVKEWLSIRPWLLLKLQSGGKGVELRFSRCCCSVSNSWPKPGDSEVKSRFCSATSLIRSSSWVTLTGGQGDSQTFFKLHWRRTFVLLLDMLFLIHKTCTKQCCRKLCAEPFAGWWEQCASCLAGFFLPPVFVLC